MEMLNKCIRYIFFGKTDMNYSPARKKSDLNEVLPDNWSFMEDPLQKNLADYLIDNNITKSKENQNFWLTNSSPPLTSFLDEYRMENANRSVYNDEFKFCSVHWHAAKPELTQNNSVGNQTGDREVVKTSSKPINIDMNPKIHDCYQAASQCSSKLEELKLKLSNKTKAKRDSKTYIRKPKKQFVEASLVEDGFEDAFESDKFDRMSNVDYIEFNNFGSNIDEIWYQIDAALMKIEDDSKQHEEMGTIKVNRNETNDSDALDTSSTVSRDNEDYKKEKKRNRKKKCKFFRVPSQSSDSEAASSFEQSPLTFTSHIDLSSSCDQTPSSLELPISFRQSLSSENLDNRRLSTTESEDSFIQFCDNGEDSCSESSVYDSNDEDYDYNSDSDVESGDITSALSKSISNLTDDILYAENIETPLPEEDQIDCAALEPEIEEHGEAKSTGILVNNAKKLVNKDKPHKTVRFSSAPPRVKVMRVWAFAARCARAGHWERYVADRDRFKKRTGEVEAAVSWVFDPKHREKMFNKIALWKAANVESIDKKAISNLEEPHSVQGLIQEVAEDSSKTLLNPEKQVVVKYLEIGHLDELSRLKESVGDLKNVVDDNLKELIASENPAISFKNAQKEHVDSDVRENMVERSISVDFKGRKKSNVTDQSENTSEGETNSDRRLLNAKDLQTANQKEIEYVRNSKPFIANLCKTRNDNQGASSNRSQIIQKEDTPVHGLKGTEDSLGTERRQVEVSDYITEETNIIEDFIIPTHKLDIQFRPEVDFVVKDSRIRIADVEMAISWVLRPQHRTRILFQRIRPWLNAQKRKEEAEKKAKEEEERLKREYEALEAIQQSKDEILPALGVKEKEVKTNPEADESETKYTEDNETVQGNNEKEFSNETFKEIVRIKKSNDQPRSKTEQNKIIPNKLCKGIDENDNENGNVANAFYDNSNVIDRSIWNKERGSKALDNKNSQIIKSTNVVEDNSKIKQEDVEIACNNCNVAVKDTVQNKESQVFFNNIPIMEKEPKRIETKSRESQDKKNAVENSNDQNRNKLSSEPNTIVETKKLKGSIRADVEKKNLQLNDKVSHKNVKEIKKLPKSRKITLGSKEDSAKRNNENSSYFAKDIPLEKNLIAKPFPV